MSNLGKCVECCSEIRPGAKKCTECGEYQSRWRRSFIYFASVTGGLTFIAAGVAYIFQSVPQISGKLFPKAAIEVLSFAENRSLILVNTGDGDIFIRAVNLAADRDDTDEFGSSSRSIGKTVQAGGTLNHSLSREDDPSRTNRRTTIEGGSGPHTDQWVDIANHIVTGGDCFELSLFHYKDNFVRTVQSHYARAGKTPMTMPHVANVSFYSYSTQKEYSVEFPVVGLVFAIQSPECSR